MSWLELLAYGALTPLAVWLCLALAPALGLVDSADEAPERKTQERPVPAVGGLALVLVGLGAWLILRFAPDAHGWNGLWLLAEPGIGPALGLAFLVGAIDDRLPGGLAPGHKVLGQVLACLPLAWVAPGIEGWALVLAGVVAMNVVNTFDNSDGCLTALSAAALAPVAAAPAVALAAFLPFNLGRLERAADGEPARAARRLQPRAYLGDGGSHLLGILLLFHPGTWLAMTLPALDLARLSVLRWRTGGKPWDGDRRHLAHRFEALGWPAWRIAALQVVIAAPTIFVGTSGAWEDPVALIGGVALTAGLFAGALLLSAQVERDA